MGLKCWKIAGIWFSDVVEKGVWVRKNAYFCKTKEIIMLDTIEKPTTFHLEYPIENISIATDSVAGEMAYHFTLAPSKEEMEKPLIIPWKGLFFSLIGVAFVAILWFWFRKKPSKRQPVPLGENKEMALRNELLRQSEVYKRFVKKGYFSKSRKAILETVKEQEINELCDSVTNVYTSFSEFLREKELSDKDSQFCCLVKSGLSTFELAEIYCVSESAIFKRKQKLKEKLGLKADKRTLDEIVQQI